MRDLLDGLARLRAPWWLGGQARRGYRGVADIAYLQAANAEGLQHALVELGFLLQGHAWVHHNHARAATPAQLRWRGGQARALAAVGALMGEAFRRHGLHEAVWTSEHGVVYRQRGPS